MPYNLIEKADIFVDEMKSIGYDVVEANDDEVLDENDFEIKFNEDLDQHGREGGSGKCDVGYYFLLIPY